MKIKLLFITLFVITFNLSSCQKKTKPNCALNERIIHVEKFYKEHITGWNNYDEYMEISKKYCSSNLFNKINEMLETYELDYDPFINAQDVSDDILDYLKVISIDDERELFEVSFRYPVQKESERTRIKLKVVCTTDGYKIDGVGEIQGNTR